jgi:hypothetical protein
VTALVAGRQRGGVFDGILTGSDAGDAVSSPRFATVKAERTFAAACLVHAGLKLADHGEIVMKPLA